MMRGRLAVVAAVGGLTVVTAACAGREVARPGDVTRYVIPMPWPVLPGLTEDQRDLAIAPNGDLLYFVEQPPGPQLWVRRRDRLEPRPLTRDGGTSPFVSRDGAWVGYQRDGRLFRVATAGGAPIELGPISGTLRGASWLSDGDVVLATDGPTGLLRMSGTTGDVRPLTVPDHDRDELDHVWPDVLPADRGVLFTIVRADGPSEIALLTLETGRYRPIGVRGSDARYARPGHLLFGRAGGLWAAGLDVGRGRLRTRPERIVEPVPIKASGAVSYAVSDGGTLAYLDEREFRFFVIDQWAGEHPGVVRPQRIGTVRPGGARRTARPGS